jgi:hypothetical protein
MRFARSSFLLLLSVAAAAALATGQGAVCVDAAWPAGMPSVDDLGARRRDLSQDAQPGTLVLDPVRYVPRLIPWTPSAPTTKSHRRLAGSQCSLNLISGRSLPMSCMVTSPMPNRTGLGRGRFQLGTVRSL